MKLETSAATYHVCRQIDYWLSAGCSEQCIKNSLGDNYRLLEDCTARVQSNQLADLFRAVAKELNDPLLGIKTGLYQIPSSVGVIGNLLNTSKNIRVAIYSSIRFFDVLSTSYERGFYETDQGGEVRIMPKSGIDTTHYQMESMLGIYVKLINFITGKNSGVLYFTHHPPTKIQDEYRSLLGLDIYFGQRFNGIYIDRSILDTRISVMGESLHREQVRLAKEHYQTIEGASTTIELLRQHFRNSDTIGRVNIEDIANQLFMSAKTLQNHLKEKEITYSKLIQQERISRVECMLREHMPPKSIAEAVGYSETSSFYRAFQSWTGVSFQEYSNSTYSSSTN